MRPATGQPQGSDQRQPVCGQDRRSLPPDFPCWQTVYGYFNIWSKDGSWEAINCFLVEKVRGKAGKHACPTAGILDSQSVRTTGGANRGYDAAKQVYGRKRFILTLLLAVWVCAASVSEKMGAKCLLRSQEQKGFKVLPRRWVVERTFAWILHARRLSKDYEKNRTNAQSMVYLAMISIMLKRL